MALVAPIGRIPYDKLPPALQERLAGRVQRLGYLGEFFQATAHQPDALAGFIDFTESLKAALPDRLVSVIALTIATSTENDYERIQHEHLALTGILSVEEVRCLTRRDDPRAVVTFSRAERTAIALAAAVAASPRRTGADELDRLSAEVGERVAVGCLMTVGRYLAHAAIANCLELDPPRSSPMEAAE